VSWRTPRLSSRQSSTVSPPTCTPVSRAATSCSPAGTGVVRQMRSTLWPSWSDAIGMSDVDCPRSRSCPDQPRSPPLPTTTATKEFSPARWKRSRGRFLSWVGRELGREIVYSSPQTAAHVAGFVVHGSISGLIPAQALEAVLAMTSVRAVMANGRIVVGSKEPAYQPAD